MKIIYLFILVLPGSLAFAVTVPEIVNLPEIGAQLRLGQFKGKTFPEKIKIAVLDNGFNGYEKLLGVTLPRDTVFHQGKESSADRFDQTSYHGLMMAQIITQIIKESGAVADYELHLFNSYGYTKLADAIDKVAEGKFHLVLYSQVWEYGGNGDGKGFINALVDKALAAGVVWVNAAGNFGRSTKLEKVDGKLEGRDEYVTFSGKEKKGVRLTCRPPPKTAGCNLRLVLGWNDFKDNAETGTDKDLDLELFDSKDKVIAASVRQQKVEKDTSNKNASLFPREVIEVEVKAGTYLARVKVISKNFSPSQDVLRITSGGAGILMLEPTTGETLLPPADHSNVIVVGASDDQESSTSKKSSKPDILLKSTVKLKDGTIILSSSTAAAMAAGVVALQLGVSTDKSYPKMLEQLIALKKKPLEKVATKKKLVDEDIAKNCLPRRSLAHPHSKARLIIADGGVETVLYRGRTALLVNYNFPQRMGIPLKKKQRLFAGPDRMVTTESNRGQDLPKDHLEVVYTGWGYRACK